MILMNNNLNKRIFNMLFKSEKNQKNEKNLN